MISLVLSLDVLVLHYTMAGSPAMKHLKYCTHLNCISAMTVLSRLDNVKGVNMCP